MMLEQPMMNIQHFSNAHAITAASPSIGVYLCTALVQNLLPENIRRQSSGQQIEAFSIVHVQCFFVGVENPFFLYSNQEQGKLLDFLSNVAMPFRTRFYYNLFGMLKCILKVLVPCKMGLLIEKIIKGQHDWTH